MNAVLAPDEKIVSSEFYDLGVLEDLKIPRRRKP
jgi:hypothetical protein